MKTSVEPTEGNKVKLVVEVPEQDLGPAIEEAFKKLSREVRLPGFRPGKVPRKVLESHFGADYARSQALQDAIPGFYTDAVHELEVDVIGSPEIDITSGESEGDVVFDAVVEIRPEIEVSGYDGLEVTIPSPLVTDDIIDEQVDLLRSQVADVEPVERAVESGDLVTVDIEGTQDGEPVPGLTAEAYVYEVGQGLVVPEIDEHLLGASTGDELEFDAPVPGQDHDHEDDEDVDHDHPSDLSFKIKVGEVSHRVLPEVDDDFAKKVSEFDTAEELMSEMRRQLTMRRVSESNNALLEGVGEALSELATDEIPEPMIAAEFENRVMDMAMRLRQQGSGIEEYMAQTGMDPSVLNGQFRTQAEQSSRLDLVLRAVATAEGLEATDDDVETEIDVMGTQLDRDPDEIRAELEHGRRMGAVRSDIVKRKALEWVRDKARIVDEDGAEVDRADLEMPDEPTDDTETPDTNDSEAESTGDDT